jgi:PKD repeat protein
VIKMIGFRIDCNQNIISLLKYYIIFLIMLSLICLPVYGNTFGTTTIGTSHDYWAQRTIAANVTAPSDIGTLLSINYYSNDTASTLNLKCAMWYPGNETLVANSVVGPISGVSTIAAWRYANFSSQPSLVSGQIYRVGCIADDAYNSYFYVADGSSPSNGIYGTADYITPSTLTISSGISQTVSIYVEYTRALTPPVSSFSANKTSGKSPLTVMFTDNSTNIPTSWKWSYKNASVGWTQFSTSQNPTASFPSGIYDINLTATNADGSDDELKTSYISASASYPLADFTGNPTSGNRPLTVIFTDASDAAGTPTYLWDFGDSNSTNSTQKSPVHTYLNGGTYTIYETVTNTTGSDTKIRNSYIIVTLPAVTHPVLVDVLQSPGYINRAISPWSSYESTITSDASIGSGFDYSQDFISAYNTSEYRARWARSMAIYYVITGDTKYANKSIESLRYAELMWRNDSFAGQARCGYLGDYAIAYDLVSPTKNVNSTLNTANDTIIRKVLANITGEAYWWQNRETTGGTLNPSYVSLVDAHSEAYFGIAKMGLVLEDYGTSANGSTPTQWIDLGDSMYFSNDTLHIQPNNGLLSFGMNRTSGLSYLGAYKYYIDGGQIVWTNMYYHAKGINLVEKYPLYKEFVMHDAWATYPSSNPISQGTDGMIIRAIGKELYPLLDSANRSFLKWTIDRQIANYPSVLPNDGKYLPTPSTYDGYFYEPNTSSYPASSPILTIGPSRLYQLSDYQLFRSGFGNYATTLVYHTWDEPFTYSNRWSTHGDQMSFDYYSHGDHLMPDTGEIKHIDGYIISNAGVTGFMHNALLIGNTPNYTRVATPISSYPSGNLTVRGFLKAGATENDNPATIGSKILTPSIEYVDAHTIINTLEPDTGTIAITLGSPINYDRGILWNKLYMIVVDRVSSSASYNYTLMWKLSSLNATGTTDTDPYASTMGKVNGNLFINGSNTNWDSKTLEVEYTTPNTANTITWQTINPYKDVVNLTIFTSPSDPTSYEKFIIRDGGYDLISEVLAPHVLTNHPNGKSLYRVTALLTKYQNETDMSATELSVSGIGSAIKVKPLLVNNIDCIYTGSGSSTFDNISTDSDTLFVRKLNNNITDFTFINGTYIDDGNKYKIYESTVRLKYLVYNHTGGINYVNLSGTSGSATLRFYNRTASTYVKLDGSTIGTWSMENTTTLKIVTPLSDHTLEFDGGEIGGSGTAPVSSFMVSPLNGTAPLGITFTDTSTNSPTSWSWGAKNITGNNTWVSFSTTQSFIQAFGLGNWSINLTASNSAGSNVSAQISYINITLPAPLSSFNATPLSGSSPLFVVFNDTSTNNPDTWLWAFGDGTFDSSRNATHWYNTSSHWIASLTSSNAYGSSISTRYISTDGTYNTSSSHRNTSIDIQSFIFIGMIILIVITIIAGIYKYIDKSEE